MERKKNHLEVTPLGQSHTVVLGELNLKNFKIFTETPHTL